MGGSSNEAQLTEEHVIIIACVCGVIIVTLLIILFCFIFRRRRNAAKTYQGGNQGDPPPYNAVPPNKKPQQGYDNQDSNRMDGFQNRDNTAGVPRTATKDKYIDLHDRGSDPMMGSDGGYNSNEQSAVGAGGKPKKVIYEVVV